MGPTFSTEIGRMRTQEMINRAEHYRLAKMAKEASKASEPEGRVVSTRRRAFLSWKRLVGVATAGLLMTVFLASSALAAQTEVGRPAAREVLPVTPTTTPTSEPWAEIALVVAVAAAALVALWVAAGERRSPKIA